MRVLVLIDAFRMGGAETLLAPMVVAARRTDVVLDVVSVSPQEVNAAKTMTILSEAGVQTQSLGIRRLLDPVALPRLNRVIRDGGYDVVHAHLEMAMTLALPACALARRPLVCTFHHVARPLSGRAGARERLAVEAATRSRCALFVSEASRESFQRAYRPRGLPENWQVMHNGIDIANFAPGQPDPAVRAELGGADRPVVLLPAAFRDFKGIPVAINAWPKVLVDHPGAVLALVGGGDSEAELRDLVYQLDLSNSVRFVGVRADMPDVYRAADMVLLPSTHGENLPTVLIEAAASARAVAASRIGGIPDIVLEGGTGVLFEPNDPADLASAVSRLLSNPQLRERFGAQATERARDEFSSDAWLARLRTLYVNVLDRSGR